MGRRAAAVLVVLALAGAAAALPSSSSAATVTRPNKAFNADGTLTPDAVATLENPAFYNPPPEGFTADQIDPVLTQSRRAIGEYPSLPQLFGAGQTGNPRMVVTSVGFAAAVALAPLAVSGYVSLWHAITGDYGDSSPQAGGGWSAATVGWRYAAIGHRIDGNATCTVGDASGLCSPASGWYMDVKYCSGSCIPNTDACTSGCGYSSTLAPAVAATTGARQMGSQITIGGVFFWYVDPQTFDAHTHQRPTDQTTYNNTTVKINYGQYTPSLSGSAATDGAGPYGDPIAGQSTAQQGAECAMVEHLGGSCSSTSSGSSFSSFVLPKPYLYETYSDYLDRLRARGWVGDATTSELPDASSYTSAGVNALGVGTIAVGDGAPVDVTDWPINAPKIAAADDPVTIEYVPSTAPSPTAAPGFTPSTATPGPIDFTPLTSLSFGCKFPFGIFCYASTVTGYFNVAPVAPEFDFTVPGFDVGGTTVGASHEYNVSLSSLDDYMATLRTIFSFVLWVGAGWFFASRVLGLQLGDPGAAIDEGLPL